MERRALVVFDSRWGNTARIAEALARGLRQVPGVTATCRSIAQVGSDELELASLVAIGGPTEFFAESSSLKRFFDRIGGFDYGGKFGFAFDTHVNSPLSGGAAGWIERRMRALGFQPIAPHRSAYTVPRPASEAGGWARAGQIDLSPGMEREFEALGTELGRAFLETRLHPTRAKSTADATRDESRSLPAPS